MPEKGSYQFFIYYWTNKSHICWQIYDSKFENNEFIDILSLYFWNIFQSFFCQCRRNLILIRGKLGFFMTFFYPFLIFFKSHRTLLEREYISIFWRIFKNIQQKISFTQTLYLKTIFWLVSNSGDYFLHSFLGRIFWEWIFNFPENFLKINSWRYFSPEFSILK